MQAESFLKSVAARYLQPPWEAEPLTRGLCPGISRCMCMEGRDEPQTRRDPVQPPPRLLLRCTRPAQAPRFRISTASSTLLCPLGLSVSPFTGSSASQAHLPSPMPRLPLPWPLLYPFPASPPSRPLPLWLPHSPSSDNVSSLSEPLVAP